VVITSLDTRLNFAAVKNMKPTKIQISPEVAAFNDAVETADALTDFRFDQESAQGLLSRLNEEGVYPYNSEALRQAICRLAIKR